MPSVMKPQGYGEHYHYNLTQGAFCMRRRRGLRLLAKTSCIAIMVALCAGQSCQPVPLSGPDDDPSVVGGNGPVAAIGEDFAVDEGAECVLVGTGSYDPQGAPLTYQWSQVGGPAVVLIDADTPIARFLCPQVDKETVLVFSLTVTSANGSSTDDIQVRVLDVSTLSSAPVADAGPERDAFEGDIVTLDGRRSYGKGELSFLWEQIQGTPVTWVVSNAATGQFLAPTIASDLEILQFRLTVTSVQDLALTAKPITNSDTAVTVVRVSKRKSNSAPTANNVTATTTAGVAVSVTLSGADVNGQDLTFSVVTPPLHGVLGSIDNTPTSTATVVYTPDSGFVGTDSFTYQASDGSLLSAAATASIVVNAASTPGALAVAPTDGLASSGGRGGPFSPASASYTLTNTGGSELSWTAAKTQPWVALSKTSGTLASGATDTVVVSIGSEAAALAAGTYSDTVTFVNATNGVGDTSRTVSLAVNALAATLSVTPAGGLSSTGAAGGPFSPASTTYTLTNTGDASLLWTANKMQSWVSLSSTGGTLTAGASTTLVVSINSNANTLAAGSYGDLVLINNATNGAGNTTRSVGLTVSAAPGRLSVTDASGMVSNGPRGGPFSPSNKSYTLTNIGGSPISWSAAKKQGGGWFKLSKASGTLAAGASETVQVSLDSSASTLSTGSYSDTVDFTNTTNGSGNDSRSVALIVDPRPAALDVAPAGGLSSTGTAGGPFSPPSAAYTLTNTGDVSLNWSAGKTQSWVSLSSTGGTLAAGASTTVTVTINTSANGLAAGSYSDTVSFSNATNGTGNTTRSVSLTVGAVPGSLSVAPASGLTSSGNRTGPFSPSNVAYALTNIGGTSLNWTASKTQTWVTLSKSSGTLAAGASDTVQVSINTNANSLAAGSYSDTVTFTNTTNGNGNSARSVTLTVNPIPASLSVTPTGGLSSTGTSGGPFTPASASYTLTNNGDVSLNWTAAKTQSWVSLSSTGGMLAAGASTTVTVTINAGANSLAAGNYSDTVTFTNATNGAGNTTRAVALTVNATPASLSVVETSTLNSAGKAGGPFSPSALTYTVRNTGGTSMNWTAAKTQSWLTLSKTSGTLAGGASDTVQVSINSGANTLASQASAYTDTVTFTNTTNDSGNTTRGVSLTVVPALTISANPSGGAVPLDVQFTASVSGRAVTAGELPAGAVLNWNYGDGSAVENGISVTHRYSAAGTYTVALSLTLVSGLNIQCSSVPLSAMATAEGWTAPYTTTAVTVDGTLSAGEWTDASSYSVNATDMAAPGVVLAGATAAASDTSATIRVKHDGTYLYIAVDVTDDNVVAAATNVWDADSVELFLDANNSRTVGIGYGERLQFDVAAGGATVATPGVPANSWNGAGRTRTGGYVVEYRLLKSALGLGATGSYGIDISINDVEPAAGTVETGYWYFSSGPTPTADESQWGTVTLVAGPAALAVSPATGLTSTGPVGGAFSPASVSYTLTNGGGASLNWTAAKTQTWVTLSKTSGTLAAGATDTVVVSIGSGASSLAAGSYSDTVTFTNTTNSAGNTTRAVALTVTPPAANTAPVANPVTASASQGTATTITLSGSDAEGADLAFEIVTPPSHGTLGTVTKVAGSKTTATVAYTPAAGPPPYVGPDSFSYRVSDGSLYSPAATVDISVTDAVPGMTTASRTSGVAPLAVFFDAVNTTSPAWSSGVVQPADGDYASFHYEWDFGDPASGNWTTGRQNPDGTYPSKNRATGYVAAHVYETPGTYTVKLTVTDTANTQYQYQQIITVQPFTGTTYYVSSSTGNDGYDGLYPEPDAQAATNKRGPFQTFAKAMSMVGTNRRILFKRGDTWNVTAGTTISASGPGIIGAYGTGNRPILHMTVAGDLFSFGTNSADWRIVDLLLRGVAVDSGGGGAVNGGAYFQRVTLLRVRAEGWRVALGNNYATANSREDAFVECEIEGSQVNDCYVGGDRIALLGNAFQNPVTSHVLRVWHASKSVIGNNQFLNPGPTRLAMKFHNEIGSPWSETRYAVVSGNRFRGATYCVSIAPQDTVSNETISDVLFERNQVESTSETQVAVYTCAHRLTVRNNVLIGTGASKYYTGISVGGGGVNLVPDQVRVLNNTIVRVQIADVSREFTAISAHSATNALLRNNLAYAPNEVYKVLISNTATNTIQDHNLLLITSVFVNADSGDFRLQASSLAVDAGADSAAVRDDILGVPRPQEAAFDVGAFEWTP